jgi:ankyrin repeat protein
MTPVTLEPFIFEVRACVRSSSNLESDPMLFTVRNLREGDSYFVGQVNSNSKRRLIDTNFGNTELNCLNLRGFAPIHIGSAMGLQEEVTLLAKKGSRLELPDSAGSTPLFHALKNGHVATAKALLALGAKLTTQNNFGFAPLHVIAWNQIHEFLHYLQEPMDLTNLESIYGDSPLDVARIKIAQLRSTPGLSVSF